MEENIAPLMICLNKVLKEQSKRYNCLAKPPKRFFYFLASIKGKVEFGNIV